MKLFELNVTGDRDLWRSAAEAAGITLSSLPAASVMDKASREAAAAQLAASLKAEKTLLLFADHGMQDGLVPFLQQLPEDLPVLPVGSDAMLLSKGNVDPGQRALVNTYLTYGGEKNLGSMMLFLRNAVFLEPGPVPEPPEVLPFDGIYREDQVYGNLQDFLDTEEKTYPCYVGMLSHRSSWLNGSLQVEKAITEALHRQNIGVIPAFSAGEKSEIVESLDFRGIVKRFFTLNGKLLIRGLVNFQMHLIKGEKGMSIADTSVSLYEKLGIPVFHPVSSYFIKESQWEKSNNPLASELQTDYLNPEMTGAIEPILAALRSEDGKTYVPRLQNIDLLARRIRKWVDLREKPNQDKKIALVLHNAVCAGVEATLGKAFGLDAFESTVRLMRRLREEGYAVEDIPESGEALLKRIQTKKAYADFRWTSVEDIISAGGCLYRMPVHPQYQQYFEELPKAMQESMLASWGKAPGEGMVMGDDLIITGLRFGNLLVLIQPKRGCYGAKCTGEVCRILHDPLCPPAHQYIATYRYLERIFGADAVIHMGTDGSLEYLPGKASGAGTESWPLQVLGSLPNFYPYHLGVTSEGTIAKRRAHASLVGYYPASSRGLSGEEQKLLERITAWQEASDLESGQAESMEQEIRALLKDSPALKKLADSAPDLTQGLSLVSECLLQCAESRKRSDLHILGENPGEQEAISYLTEVLRGEEVLKMEEGESEAAYEKRLQDTVKRALSGEEDLLSQGIRRLYEKLMETGLEQDRLVDLLSGRYQPPSEGGMPDENGRRILPPGRNFYRMASDKVPTREAWARGKILADQLLDTYRQEEGKYPEKIAMNMISLDISRTHGEQLCQFLWLLGVRPRWDRKGRVKDLEVMALSELNRPRIDITLRISGVMRDTWPEAVQLMDQAVVLVSSLEEADADNYILKNIRDMEKICGPMTDREKTIRIFGDPPGAFGAGIDLALRASAWENDRDLARYFIQSSAFAYGKDLEGRKSVREFVENARKVDVSCDVSSSRRMDSLSCGFSVEVHGGFRLLAKTLGNKEIRQYQASSELGEKITTDSLSDTVERDIRNTLLNPLWQAQARSQGYTGAAEIMRRIQTTFDAQCTSEAVSDQILDKLAEAYLEDPDMRAWLLKENPYAAEEIGRRLLELQTRGKWQPDPDVLEHLRENYLSLEGTLEEGVSGQGEIQGSSVEIIRDDQVENWKNQLKDIDDYLKKFRE